MIKAIMDKSASKARYERTMRLFRAQRENLLRRTDRLFAVLMVLQSLAEVAIALTYSPKAWPGDSSSVDLHVWMAVLFGAGLTGLSVYMALTRPGASITRHTIAVCQMLTSAVLVHLTGGRIETHFHVFGSLAFLAAYRDFRVLVTATAIVIADHLLRGIYWQQSVYGVLTEPLWKTLEHGGWVIFEITLLSVAIRQGIQEMWGIAEQQTAMEEARDRIESEVQERTKDLQHAEARTRAILDTAPDGIITMDHNGLVQSVNRATEEIFGHAASEMVGRNVSMLMPSPYREAHDGYLARYLETRKKTIIGINREVTGLRKDGSTFPLDLVVSESHFGVFTGIVRDITDRKEIDRMKTEFISTVSHELRTPLTSIRGSLGLLQGGFGGELAEKGASLLNIALNNTDRLVRLVNDILDIEKIESGKMALRMERQDLTEVVKTAIVENQSYGDQHGVRFEMKDAPPGAFVLADRDRILQVMTNLLANATKFSARGQAVTVAVRNGSLGPRVEVADKGPGIPHDFRSRIFGKFSQADSTDTRQKGGTGLGLSICKAIVEKHGGTIGFDSRVGVGTTFYFELPKERAAQGDAHPPLEPRRLGGGPRILVCEDDADIAKLLTLMLERRGLVVDRVTDSREARAKLACERYEAMTLDLMLPGCSGLRFLQELGSDEGTRGLPVVVVSAKAMEVKRELEGEAIGVIEWLSKPIDEDRLINAVWAAVRRSAADPVDHAQRVLHVEDDEDLCRVVHGILEPVAKVVGAKDLAAARRLLQESDFDVVILDLDLPDGIGLSLIPLRSRRGEPIPVVVYSAEEVRPDVSRSVSAALVKSCTSNEKLAATISSLIKPTCVVNERT